jgi:hypothetical protein
VTERERVCRTIVKVKQKTKEVERGVKTKRTMEERRREMLGVCQTPALTTKKERGLRKERKKTTKKRAM